MNEIKSGKCYMHGKKVAYVMHAGTTMSITYEVRRDGTLGDKSGALNCYLTPMTAKYKVTINVTVE